MLAHLFVFIQEYPNRTARAFAEGLKDFQDPLHNLDAFLAYLRDCCNKFWYSQYGTYVAAYTTLVQSSGVGKSLLVKQVLKHEFGIYICLRPEAPYSTGFPPRTIHVADFLLRDPANLIHFNRNVISKLKDWCTRNQVDLEHKGTWIAQWNEYVGQTEVLKELAKPADNATPIDLRTLPAGVKQFFIFYDEASYFFAGIDRNDNEKSHMHFRRCRDAWKDEALFRGGFVVLLDTHSRVSNFAPTASQDSSQRREGRATKLFHPFYLLSTMDVIVQLPRYQQHLGATVTDGIDSKVKDLACLLTLGRPLWFASLNIDRVPRESTVWLALIRDLVEFAATKMCYTSAKHPSLLPLACCRVPLNISPTSRLAQTLVAEQMALCMHVSEDRSSMMVRYASEPVMAEASAMKTLDDGKRAAVVEVIHTSITKSEVNVGYVGEVVAELLLLYARDSLTLIQGPGDQSAAGLGAAAAGVAALNTSAPSQSVGRVSSSTDLASGTTKPSLSAATRPAIPVNEFVSTECSLALFLQAFCNASDSFVKGVSDRFSKDSSVLVRLTHFVPITYTPSCQEELRCAYERAAGMVCKPGPWGVDLIVPVKVVLASGEVKYSCLLFQVKNIKCVSDSHLKDFIEKSGLDFALPGFESDPFVSKTYLVFLINLGDSQTQPAKDIEQLTAARTQKGKKRGNCSPVGLYMRGLDGTVFPFLRNMPLTLAALQRLLDKGTDPRDMCSEGEKPRVVALRPLTYKS